MRCLIRETARAAQQHDVGGWRQWKHLTARVKNAFNRIRRQRQANAEPSRVEDYRCLCEQLLRRAEQTLWQLSGQPGPELVRSCAGIQHYIKHARRQLDQVERRLIKGEVMPHSEKVFSIFEPHTRWISKGKAGRPVELGVPVCVVEDNYGFILQHEIMWEGGDGDIAVSIIKGAQKKYPDLGLCSFDRGFHSPQNRIRLDALLDDNVLPRKGRWSKSDRERETQDTFLKARRQHPAIESAINNLEHRGLDRVRAYGADGFARMVALSMVAFNVHRLGLVLRRQEREKLRRKKRCRAA